MKILGLTLIYLMALPAIADNASTPLAAPVLERPTLRCLSAYWIIKGDDNANASITTQIRKAGDPTWKPAAPFFRVEKGKHQAEKYGSKLNIPEDATLFAGSFVLLDPDTAYELQLTLTDPDGGSATQVLTSHTRAEPIAPANAEILHVIPATNDPAEKAGAGTAADPVKGITAALKLARPNTILLLHAGTYDGTVEINKSGEPIHPIILRAAGDGEAILDGAKSTPATTNKAGKRCSRIISASDAHDVWFEGLTLRNADWGIVAHDSARIVIRRCRITDVEYGITSTRDTNGVCNDFFISDNYIEGPSTWPRTKGIENARGIQITGAGHVVCYNRIRRFADAMDTFNSPRCEAIDFHNNDCSECTDDGCEMDYSQRNTRCFNNRFTNIYQGISVQPIFGGPTYIFNNALYNVVMEPFKIHNSPSGAIFYHNTIVKKGPPLLVYTNEPASNLVMRNNLFIGTETNHDGSRAAYAWECSPKMINCDFDFDGFAAGNFKMFLKWNNQRYATFDQMKAKAPIERHATSIPIDGLFATGVKPPANESQEQPTPDLRLSPATPAIDAGQPLPGFNDAFTGKAPDLGTYESGQPLPQYGPRPLK